MVICPVALAVGCKKCPIFSVCPVKGVIGDYRKEDAAPAAPAPGRAKASPKSAAKSASKGGTRNGGKGRAKRAK